MMKIWISDRIVKDETGFMRICKKIKFDKSMSLKLQPNEETLNQLEKAREKNATEEDFVKALIDGK